MSVTSPISCNLIFEDLLSEAVMKRLLEYSGRYFMVGKCHLGRGNGFIKRTISGFNKAARGMPYFALTDCDNYQCPIDLIHRYLPDPIHPNLIFRVAVNEVESWILADRDGFAAYLKIDATRIPLDCDQIQDPKEYIISLARKCRNTYLKRGIVPTVNSTAKQGPYYNDCIIPFVREHWNISLACQHSQSLTRAVRSLATFEPHY